MSLFTYFHRVPLLTHIVPYSVSRFIPNEIGKFKWNLIMSIKTWYSLTCNPERIGHVKLIDQWFVNMWLVNLNFGNKIVFELFSFWKQNFSLLICGARIFIRWRKENFVSKLFKYIPNIKLLIDLNNGVYLIDFLFLKNSARFLGGKEI